VRENVPPYAEVSSVAVVTTSESAGIGSSIANIKLDSGEVAEAAKAGPLLEVAFKGVGAGAAIGLKSVVASTTI
jgi:hypothetical protein